VDTVYLDAEVIRVVLPRAECARNELAVRGVSGARGAAVGNKLEFHFTPKHGSWLKVAECELAVLASQCRAQWVDTIASVRGQVGAWEHQRNQERPTVKWHPTTGRARHKLKHLYPVLARQQLRALAEFSTFNNHLTVSGGPIGSTPAITPMTTVTRTLRTWRSS
jgi:hypothetical protein